jgi:hypothetical protein
MRDGNVQYLGELKKPTRANAIAAIFIFLNLLEGYARSFPEGGLTNAQEDAPLAQAGSDVNVYRMASQKCVCLQSQSIATITYDYMSIASQLSTTADAPLVVIGFIRLQSGTLSRDRRAAINRGPICPELRTFRTLHGHHKVTRMTQSFRGWSRSAWKLSGVSRKRANSRDMSSARRPSLANTLPRKANFRYVARSTVQQ